MSTFKFACPSCRQHVETGPDVAGRHIECPACKTRMIIPAPPIVPGLVPIAAWETPPEQPAPPIPIAEPKPAAATPPPPVAPKPEEQAPVPDVDNPFTVTAESQKVQQVPHADMRVAVLTPQLKLEIIRAVRAQITDESRWLPGKTGDTSYAYAAKRSDGKIVPVPFNSVEATHFSIFGSVLLEFHRRNVANTATGRREFLDTEMSEAIQEVLSEEAHASTVSEKDRPPLTHEQCMAVLDLLEKRYSAKMARNKAERDETRLQRIGLDDLVRKLEKKAPIKPEDVATVLYHELDEIKTRLTALERDSTKDK